MELEFGAQDEAYRAEVRSWLESNVSAFWDGARENGAPTDDDGFPLRQDHTKALAVLHIVHGNGHTALSEPQPAHTMSQTRRT